MTQEQMPHRLTLDQRQKLSMCGVTEVVSFDEETVVLKTDLGTLVVQGQGLQLKQLTPDGGQVAVEGNIGALHYEQPKNTGGWRSRLFG